MLVSCSYIVSSAFYYLINNCNYYGNAISELLLLLFLSINVYFVLLIFTLDSYLS